MLNNSIPNVPGPFYCYIPGEKDPVIVCREFVGINDDPGFNIWFSPTPRRGDSMHIYDIPVDWRFKPVE